MKRPFRPSSALTLAALVALSASNALAQLSPPRRVNTPTVPRLPGVQQLGTPGAQPGVPGAPGATGAGRTFVPPGIEQVAGVRLDRPAEMPPGMSDIRAVAYDAKEKRLYLVGRSQRNLPSFRPEDLAVAFRALDEGYPAVSIEGPIRDGQRTVKYYGGIENTRFGQVLFEADRLLKSLSLGRDNITKKAFRAPVRGYESEVHKLRRMGGAQRPRAWHRYWFQPSRITMTTSEDGQALRFDEVKIEVKTEYVPALAPGESEPAAEEFAQHFTDHYDEFAAVYPVFAELKELAKVTALAQWLKESGIPTASLGLDRAVIPTVETPKTTPIGYAQALALMPEGLWKHQMEGGVSFRLWKPQPPAEGEAAEAATAAAGNWTVNRVGNAKALLKSVMKKPTVAASQWLSTYAPAPAPAVEPVQASGP